MKGQNAVEKGKLKDERRKQREKVKKKSESVHLNPLDIECHCVIHLKSSHACAAVKLSGCSCTADACSSRSCERNITGTPGGAFITTGTNVRGNVLEY